MQKRMNDAQYNLRIPLCKTCANRVLHKYDANDPLKPIMTCRVYGTIPEAIELVKERECENYNEGTLK